MHLLIPATVHRKKYIIPLSQIVKAIFYTTILSINSFLSKDKFLRNAFFRKFIGSTRYMVASDSTLERNLSNNINSDELKKMNIQFLNQIPKQDLIEPVLKKVCGIMDGTVVGKFMKEFFLIPGKSDFIYNFCSIPKRGKELCSAELQLKEAGSFYGKGFFNLMLFDSLYYSQNIFRACKEYLGAYALVKTQERLNIVTEAENLINGFSKDMETIKGFDNERQAKYTIYRIKDIKADTIEYPLQIAIIEEEYIKRKKDKRFQKFYVITNDLTLTPHELRYAGHLRWRIENNEFKKMNHLYLTKHRYSSNELCFSNLLWFIVMAYNLFFYFLKKADLSSYGLIGKRTVKDWIELIKNTLMLYYRLRLINSS